MNMIIKSAGALAATAHLLDSAGYYTKDAGDPLDVLAKKFGDHVSEVLTKLGATNQDLAGVKEQLNEMEQKAARVHLGGYDNTVPTKSLGAMFIKERGDDLAEIAIDRGRTSFEMKATITSATTDALGSAGDAIRATRDPGFGVLPKRRMTIRNLLYVVQIETGSVEYVQQTGRVNNSAMVAEAAAKPQSDLKLELKNVPIRTVAHWMKASRQVLDDVSQLRQLIDDELLYGLALTEESQLLYGDGTGQNLNGMVPQATAFSAPITIASPNSIDNIGLAILQASLTDIPPDGIILNPADWWWMRLLKDADGKYILGDPMSVVPPTLFGLPVVVTQAMNIDKFLVGAFQAQTLYDRWSARVEVGFVNDDFTRNLVTILGEERVGFAAKRPETLIHGDFGRVT